MVDLRAYEKLHTIQMLKDWSGAGGTWSSPSPTRKGYVLDHAEGKVIPPNNDFCRLALFSKEGFRRCNESVKVTRDKLRGAGAARRPSLRRPRVPPRLRRHRLPHRARRRLRRLPVRRRQRARRRSTPSPTRRCCARSARSRTAAAPAPTCSRRVGKHPAADRRRRSISSATCSSSAPTRSRTITPSSSAASAS